MYKLLIVDNDRQARERLLESIPMEKFGLTLCAQVENGIQAMEQFMRHRPEIVLLDVKLPLINGIDVTRQILQVEPKTHVIVATASDSLDYAREAVRCGIVDYLKKPVSGADLESALRKVVVHLRTAAAEQERVQRKDRLLTASLPLLRSSFFLELMRTQEADVDTAQCMALLRDFGVDPAPTGICAAVLVPNYNHMQPKQRRAMQSTLADELQKLFAPMELQCIVVHDSMQRTAAILCGGASELTETAAQKLSLLRDKMRYIYRLDFRAGVGCRVDSFPCLHRSWEAAERALCYWTIVGDNNIVNSDDLKNVELPALQNAGMQYAQIMDLLVTYDPEQIRQTLERYMRRMAYETRNSIHNLQMLAVELLALLLSCARELGASADTVANAESTIYVRVLQTGSIHEIMQTVQDTASVIVNSVQGDREENKIRALSDAKRYIMRNFADPDLSLAKVAEQVNLSPSYMSQLFKRTDDRTFTEYLNHVRIEQAKKLLSTTHMRVYEVADAVGYQSSKYFFQLFKQITGKRPREFYEASAASGKKEN